MDDFVEENTEKNSSNRKLISYSTEFRQDNNLNNFVGKLWKVGKERRGANVLQTYI